MTDRPSAVVVGGGIAGLAAAEELSRTHRVTVLEASVRVGGKLRGHDVAGLRVDVGAESMLNSRPEGVGLARSAGLHVVHPTGAAPYLWTRGELRRLPRTLLGVPLDADDLAASGVLSDAGLARALAGLGAPLGPVGEDLTIAELVGRRLGQEVVDRLVEPLLGGVYAGHAANLSTRAAAAQLLGPTPQQSADQRKRPVFAGVEGGMWRLPAALAAGAAPAEGGRYDVRCGATVRELARTPSGFRLTIGPTTAQEYVEADAVVLATPAPAAARLLRGIGGRAAVAAASALGQIEYASVAIATFAYRAADLPAVLAPEMAPETAPEVAAEMAQPGAQGPPSGFLVPPIDGRRIKAATLSFAKWDWVRDAGRGAGPGGEDLLLLRASLGRHREEATLQASDGELLAACRGDLADAIGLVAAPVDQHLQRWGGALPQYALGHLDRVARVRAALPAGLAVCGAAYDGVGIPAVIASAHAAARAIAKPRQA